MAPLRTVTVVIVEICVLFLLRIHNRRLNRIDQVFSEFFKLMITAVFVIFDQRKRPYVVAPFFVGKVSRADRNNAFLQSSVKKRF